MNQLGRRRPPAARADGTSAAPTAPRARGGQNPRRRCSRCEWGHGSAGRRIPRAKTRLDRLPAFSLTVRISDPLAREAKLRVLTGARRFNRDQQRWCERRMTGMRFTVGASLRGVQLENCLKSRRLRGWRARSAGNFWSTCNAGCIEMLFQLIDCFHELDN